MLKKNVSQAQLTKTMKSMSDPRSLDSHKQTLKLNPYLFSL